MHRALLALLALYKRWISPQLGLRCRFQPSCSDYARIAIVRFGVGRGSLLAAWRLARCQPFARAGFDPVPAAFPHFCRRAPKPTQASPRACNAADPAAHCPCEATSDREPIHPEEKPGD